MREREACFCWCFWYLDIPTVELQAASDIMVRAMDDSMMVQPRDMYWSLLGMMNNPWYRLVIHQSAGRLRFEHPTQPILGLKGWMERVKEAGGDLTNGYWGENISGNSVADKGLTKEICMVDERKAQVTITWEVLKQHEGVENPWFVVNGQVYDGTKYMSEHPGGASAITGAAGKDVTGSFLEIREYYLDKTHSLHFIHIYL